MLLSFNISGLSCSVVDCWHSMPDAMGFEFWLRFDFSPSVTFGTQCDPQPQLKSLILYHISYVNCQYICFTCIYTWHCGVRYFFFNPHPFFPPCLLTNQISKSKLLGNIIYDDILHDFFLRLYVLVTRYMFQLC